MVLQPIQIGGGGPVDKVQFAVDGWHEVVPVHHGQALDVQGLPFHRLAFAQECGPLQLTVVAVAPLQGAVDEDQDGVHKRVVLSGE